MSNIYCINSATNVVSAVEKEDQLMKAIKPFKARPVSAKILESKGDIGVPRVLAKNTTVAIDMKFATDQRIIERKEFEFNTKSNGVQKKKTRKPQPKPTIFSPPKGPTIANSPNITKPRPRPQKKIPTISPFVAQPLPTFSR